MRNPATPVPLRRTKTMTCNTMQTWLLSPETTAVHTGASGPTHDQNDRSLQEVLRGLFGREFDTYFARRRSGPFGPWETGGSL